MHLLAAAAPALPLPALDLSTLIIYIRKNITLFSTIMECCRKGPVFLKKHMLQGWPSSGTHYGMCQDAFTGVEIKIASSINWKVWECSAQSPRLKSHRRNPAGTTRVIVLSSHEHAAHEMRTEQSREMKGTWIMSWRGPSLA